MENNDIFYRPPWTCGKYNADKHVAVIFNTLERMNYFFEAESADVVGFVLSAGRGGRVSVDELSDKSNIVPQSILVFFDELCSTGLLSKQEITKNVIEEKRKEARGSKTPIPIISRTKEMSDKDYQSAYQAYTEAVRDNVALSDVMFELTYRCQAQCIHCYNPGATRNKNERNGRADIKELSLEDYHHIIDDLCDNGLTTATISGGDPFAHPYIWQILDHLFKHDIAISVYTNGLGVVGNEERLAEYYPYLVQCSLYSGDPAVHDKITRVKGSWKRTISVMDKLHELGVPIDISCPLMQTNLKSYFSVKPYVKKYGSTQAFDLMLTDSIDGDKCVSKHLRLTPEQLSVVLLDEDVLQHIPLEKVKNNITVDRSFLNGTPCGAANEVFCINPNGDVIPCCTFHKVLGNVKKDSIKLIVKTNAFLDKWHHIKKEDYGECYTHEYCFYCNFCPGNNFNDKGEPLNGGENNCYLAKARYNTIMRLREGKDILNGKTIEDNIKEMNVKEDELKHEYS